MAVRSDATDDYDEYYDFFSFIPNAGYVGVYHDSDSPDWSGPTAFYRIDQRSLPAPDESKTWTPIHLWADPDLYDQEEMMISFEADTVMPPPDDRRYTLELLYVPEGIEGAPPFGQTWELDLDKTLTITVPTFASYVGLDGYQFAFTFSAVVDPCAATRSGDANCDGEIDFFDIDAFVQAVSGGEEAWEAYLGGTPACDFLCANDVNGDGGVDFFDIDTFVACVTVGCE